MEGLTEFEQKVKLAYDEACSETNSQDIKNEEAWELLMAIMH